MGHYYNDFNITIERILVQLIFLRTALQHCLHAEPKLYKKCVQTENKCRLQNDGRVKKLKGARTVGCKYNRRAQRVAKSFLVTGKHSNVSVDNAVT